jgi:glutathione S-transferase
MLDAKGVAYKRIGLFPALSRAWLRLTGFRSHTVPAMRIDGTRVQGTLAIALALDASWPEPALFPPESQARARVEEIEAWADGPLQGVVRRIILWSVMHSPEAVDAALEGAHLQFQVPVRLAALTAWPILCLDAALNSANADAVRADLAALPAMLDRADAWIALSDLGTPAPTVADYQVAGSVRLLLTVEDLAPLLAGRPCAALARRLIPAFPGYVPAGVLPSGWIDDREAATLGLDR